MNQNPNLDRALGADELRIIGVEFNVRRESGAAFELGMFVPNGSGLVIPRARSVMGGAYHSDGYRPTITFHSTVGDYTIGNQDYGCPW